MTLKELQLERTPCLVFSRNNGYLQPVQNWNPGKKSEWDQRQVFSKINKHDKA